MRGSLTLLYKGLGATCTYYVTLCWTRRGVPCSYYITLFKEDTGLDNAHEIETVMLCRETWSCPLLQSFDWGPSSADSVSNCCTLHITNSQISAWVMVINHHLGCYVWIHLGFIAFENNLLKNTISVTLQFEMGVAGWESKEEGY